MPRRAGDLKKVACLRLSQGCVDALLDEGPTAYEAAQKVLESWAQRRPKIDRSWRCAVCGCTAIEAARRCLSRGRALPRNAVTCGDRACKRERERERLRKNYGPGTAYYRSVNGPTRRR